MTNSIEDGAPIMGPASADPMEQEYTLQCKVRIVEKSYDDIQSKGSMGNITRRFVLLMPEQTSEMIRFFEAWVGAPGKRVELLAAFHHPFKVYGRICIMGPRSVDADSVLDEYHLFLMSYGLSQMMIEQEGSRTLLMRKFRPRQVILTTCKGSIDHPDGSPTDGTGAGDDLYSGTRKEIKTGFESQGHPRLSPTDLPRLGRRR
jgi:hypothetical protein